MDGLVKKFLLLVDFQKYYEKLIFNIINIVSHNIVLGVLWLKNIIQRLIGNKKYSL